MSGYLYTQLGRFIDSGGAHLNVQHHRFAGGAKGNGIANDTAALQAAIDEAEPGDTLLFPRPAVAYRTTEMLDFAGKEDLAIKGQGGYPVRIEYAGGGARAVMSLVGARKLLVSGIHAYSANPSSPAKTAIALGRPAGDPASYGEHRFDDLWLSGYVSHSLLYNCASEENLWIGGKFVLYGGGAKYNYVLTEADDLGVGGFVASSCLENWMYGVRMTRSTPYAGAGDDDCALVYVVARGATGDFALENSFLATTAGAGIRFEVPDQAPNPNVSLGPYSIRGVRIENYGTQKYGVYVGKRGTVSTPELRRLDMHRLTNGNLHATGSYGVYVEDDVLLRDCSFIGSNPIREDGSMAPSSVWKGEDLAISEPAHTFTVRQAAATTYREGGRKVWRVSAPGWALAGTATASAPEFLDVAIPGVEPGDQVHVSTNPSSSIPTSVEISGYVVLNNSPGVDDDYVRVLVRNHSATPYAGTLNLMITVVR